eukprot:766792-Hanusia_phi.AAC.2
MELGFEGILQGGATVFQDIMQRFRKDEPSAGAANFEDQLPVRINELANTKGILQFRFKAKESKLTAVSDKPIEKPQWASLRTAAVSRKASQVALGEATRSLIDRIQGDTEKKPSTMESFAAKFTISIACSGWLVVKLTIVSGYVLTLCLRIVWKVLEIALSIASALRNGIFALFRSRSHEMNAMRQARTTIVK